VIINFNYCESLYRDSYACVLSIVVGQWRQVTFPIWRTANRWNSRYSLDAKVIDGAPVSDKIYGRFPFSQATKNCVRTLYYLCRKTLKIENNYLRYYKYREGNSTSISRVWRYLDIRLIFGHFLIGLTFGVEWVFSTLVFVYPVRHWWRGNNDDSAPSFRDSTLNVQHKHWDQARLKSHQLSIKKISITWSFHYQALQIGVSALETLQYLCQRLMRKG
jgi:hypothetical protein